MVFVGKAWNFSLSLVCDIPGTDFKYAYPKGEVVIFPVTDQGCVPRHPISKGGRRIGRGRRDGARWGGEELRVRAREGIEGRKNVAPPPRNKCLPIVCVCIACPVFIIAAQLGNKVICYQLSPLTLQITVNSCTATQTIKCPSVLETVSIRETNL